MPRFHEMRRSQRIEISNQEFQNTMRLLEIQDLDPLCEMLGIDPNGINFTDLFETEADFQGQDINLNHSMGTKTIQSRTRHSGSEDGHCDLATELSRIYKFRNKYDRNLNVVVDGGRDTHRVKRNHPIEICNEKPETDWLPENIGNVILAQRDWNEPITGSDVYLLEKVYDDTVYWIKYEPVKNLMKNLFKKWISCCPNYFDALHTLFLGAVRSFPVRELCSTGIDARCMRDVTRKDVLFDGQIKKDCNYVKIVVFVRFEELFEEGRDWCKTKRRIYVNA